MKFYDCHFTIKSQQSGVISALQWDEKCHISAGDEGHVLVTSLPQDANVSPSWWFLTFHLKNSYVFVTLMFYLLCNFRVHPGRVEVFLPRCSSLQPARSSSRAERLSHTHTHTHMHIMMLLWQSCALVILPIKHLLCKCTRSWIDLAWAEVGSWKRNLIWSFLCPETFW